LQILSLRGRVDDRFSHDVWRNLVGDGCLDAQLSCADCATYHRQHEIESAIHLLKQAALEHLVGGGGPLHGRAVKVHASQIGGRDESLGVATEQQQRCR